MKAKRFLLSGMLVASSVTFVLAEPVDIHWVCHRTNGTNNPWNLISVSETALDRHLGHGDLYAGSPAEVSEPIFGWDCSLVP